MLLFDWPSLGGITTAFSDCVSFSAASSCVCWFCLSCSSIADAFGQRRCGFGGQVLRHFAGADCLEQRGRRSGLGRCRLATFPEVSSCLLPPVSAFPSSVLSWRVFLRQAPASAADLCRVFSPPLLPGPRAVSASASVIPSGNSTSFPSPVTYIVFPTTSTSRRTTVALLESVGQFVGDQLSAIMALGLKFIFAEEDVVARGKGVGVQLPVEVGRLVSGVDLTALKSAPKRGSMNWRTPSGKGEPPPAAAFPHVPRHTGELCSFAINALLPGRLLRENTGGGEPREVGRGNFAGAQPPWDDNEFLAWKCPILRAVVCASISAGSLGEETAAKPGRPRRIRLSGLACTAREADRLNRRCPGARFLNDRLQALALFRLQPCYAVLPSFRNSLRMPVSMSASKMMFSFRLKALSEE